jgi:RNA 2',3'-cyclic 3'-phosphodiesterase
LRAFVALEVPREARDSLAIFQEELSKTGADLKLVEKENLHFTLKFLGEISQGQAAEAGSRLGRLKLHGGEVEIRGAGAFPSPNRPRVVWAGVAPDGEPMVTSIAEEVISALDGIGELDDRPFRAHITLARVRSDRNSGGLARSILQNSSREFGRASLSELKLKSSRLQAGGPVYSDLEVFHLS